MDDDATRLDARSVDLEEDEGPTRLDLGDFDTSDAPRPLFEPPPAPTHVGRYMIIDEIGRGGMGVVFRAYDPRLQREVALKKLVAHQVSTEAQARMVREARAMAKLSHPNVVAVYDVETEDDDVVLAMELVEGQPLSRWLRTEHAWPQVLSVFAAAGRGLAAAHAAGLLHRDFKPANVIVREDGRAQVTDFGLARTPTSPSRPDYDPATEGDDGLGDASIDTQLTVVGTVVGTPPYMAPEYHLGKDLDATVDQYAFCVSLWRALTGTLPFVGPIDEQWTAKSKGPPPWPSDLKIPTPIVAAIVRGLSPSPNARWPSMESLLAALAHRPKRRDRVWALATIGALAIGAAAAATATFTGTASEACSGSEAAIAEVWGDPARASVHTAIVGIERPYAASVAKWVREDLDQRAQDWIRGHRDACEATTIRGEQSEAVMDLRMACLTRARQEFGAVVGVLQSADAPMLERTEELLGGMTNLDRCSDVVSLQEAVPPPTDPRVATAVAAVREGLSEVSALHLAARLDAADARLAAIENEASALDYPPLRTEILLRRGRIDNARGRYAEAEASLREAMREGLRWGQWHDAWNASNGLVLLVGDRLARHDAALAYVDMTMGLLAHVGMGGIEEASSRTNHGQLLLARGKLTEAEAEQRAALALYEKIRGPEHPDMARVRNNLALTLQAQGRYDEATTELLVAKHIWDVALSPDYPEASDTLMDLGIVQKAQGRLEDAEATFHGVLDNWERVLGPDHPRLFAPWLSLSNALRAQGKLDEAQAAIRRAIELSEAVHGPVHVNTALARATLALLLKARGDDQAAEAELRPAIAATEASLGREHPRALTMRGNLANILKNLKRLDEAEAELRSVLALERAALGPEHPQVAGTLHNLANVVGLAGRPEEAAPLFEQAASLREKVLGPTHRRVAMSLTGWGTGLIEQGRPQEALEPLRRAWTILEEGESAPLERARVGFAFARALWDSEEDRAQAQQLVGQVHEWFLESRGPDHPETLEVVQWLADHPASDD